jgi:RecB family exonuclease
MSMIRAVADGYPRLDLARFLVSPHFKKIPSDVRKKAPEAALNSGMIKGRGAWIKALEADSARWIFRILDPLYSIRSSSTFDMFINVLRKILDAFIFHPDDSSPAEAARMLESLRPCGEIAQKEVSLPDFADALESLLWSSHKDDESSGVETATIFEVRGLEPDILYIGGLKDGDIPSRPNIDLLLPDTVRKRLGLVDVNRHMDLQEKIFTRLRMSARELYLSYPAMEEDKVYLPSVFLSAIADSPYPVTGHYSVEEAMTAWGGDSLTPRLGEITLPGAYARERTLSVTEIDSYRRCPRRFAIERLLGISPTEISEYELEPTELGSIVHRIMENLITGHTGTLDEFRLKAAGAIETAITEAGTDVFFSDLIRESFLSVLPGIHELEISISADGYRVKAKEEEIRGEPLAGIKLKGKADRIDISSEGKTSLIDYKTGSATISGQALESRGENLQLFLYAAMLRDMGIDTERVGIYSLKDIDIKWVPGKRDISKNRDIDYFMDAALSYLSSTVNEMRQGQFPARPIAANVCNNCHEVPFCPYFQSSVNDRGDDAFLGGGGNVQ